MSVSNDIRAELHAAEQEEQAAAQAVLDAANRPLPNRFADPTQDHVDRFNFVESRGFLKVFFESILVNFGPNPDPNIEAAFQRDMYFSLAGFTSGDASTDHRMQFARVADTNAPPPIGNTNLSDNIAPVTNFSRGSGTQLDQLYANADAIFSERLDRSSAEMRAGFSGASANPDTAPTQTAENNYAPGLSIPVA